MYDPDFWTSLQVEVSFTLLNLVTIFVKVFCQFNSQPILSKRRSPVHSLSWSLSPQLFWYKNLECAPKRSGGNSSGHSRGNMKEQWGEGKAMGQSGFLLLFHSTRGLRKECSRCGPVSTSMHKKRKMYCKTPLYTDAEKCVPLWLNNF